MSAISSTPLSPLAQSEVERIALRTKVFETAISSSRTVPKYINGPSSASQGEVFDWEEIEPPFSDYSSLEVEKIKATAHWAGTLKP